MQVQKEKKECCIQPRQEIPEKEKEMKAKTFGRVFVMACVFVVMVFLFAQLKAVQPINGLACTAEPTKTHPTKTPCHPTATQPEPTNTVPAPTNTVPAPTNTVPAPTETQPAPTATQPIPTVTATERPVIYPTPVAPNTGASDGTAKPFFIGIAVLVIIALALIFRRRLKVI